MNAKTIGAVILSILTVAACTGKDVEVGPYTVSTIEKNVYHIQDYNSSNPAGESFDAAGEKTHFNNCSDIYLIVGSDQALLIDLSNRIDWADNADESLRAIVAERIAGKPLTITFTHNHGDHTGMLPAFVDDPAVSFALPQADFARLAARFPEAQRRFYREGEIFDLGDMQVEAIAVPGHTAGSMVFALKGHDILFTGDAIGSGHGVWIFNEEGFNNYVSAVPHLIEWVENPDNGVNQDRLRIYGGHYWQKDWLDLRKGKELGMQYLRDMKALLDEMESGTAATEPSNLGRPGLETYFRHGDAIVTWSADQAEQYRKHYPEKFVYRDADIVIRQIDEHTWEGNGHLVYNESVYIVEGNDRALVIDAGSRMPNLDKAVAKITDKPVILAVTHGHGDHVGGAVCFPEVYIHPADTSMISGGRAAYKGQIKYLNDGDVIDLGGRQIEVLHTPGHTAGSITFFDKANHYGFSGDAFGSTNLLLFTGPFSALINSTSRTAQYMEQNGITKLYPGHYHGDNPETLQRVLDEMKMSQEVLAGRRKGMPNTSNGLNRYIEDYGVTIRYNDPDALR
ncbi:MAG: MBL fold metallo-hydrolase [Bacteroidales bacterium]|nr:MBL fold metallo-hydrolase [Bacteroidales bacterium]MBR5670766.1 MBL fold metallo-hydrolase [Bacteroidales bacterium]